MIRLARQMLRGLGIALLSTLPVYAGSYRAILIVSGDHPTAIETNILNLLAGRITENCRVGLMQLTESEFRKKPRPAPGTLTILATTGNRHQLLEHLGDSLRIPHVTPTDPGPEGFLLKTVTGSPREGDRLMMTGVDHRGLLYAVGALLRQCTFQPATVEIPNLFLRTAPAFEVRGTQYGQSGVAKQKAKVRSWTEAEKQRAILDLALAGANTFLTERTSADMAFLKSFDLMAADTYNPNMVDRTDFPEAWRASESIGRLNYLCPSVPEARAYLLSQCEAYFKKSPSFDFIQLKGGDGGGCECDRCRPYGNTFIHLSEEMARIIHRYHPDTRLYFTNQKFDNESDQAILSYLHAEPRNWLWAWGYGPGSDATTWQPGHRQNHRMDLFRYPGFGPYGLYPKELLHQLPSRHKILYFNEITHWKYAQHGYIQMYPRADREGNLPPRWSHEIYERRPDQCLTMVYDRLTFYAWPKYYHRVFNDLMRYGVGDVTHSSGNHDHFNQWMWQRLLWSPRMEVQEVVAEYARTWFGKEAAPLMSEAILLLEDNMEEKTGISLPDKGGIDRFYRLVAAAGQQIPAHLRKQNWLWYMFMQKAALDLYVKHDATRQRETQRKIEQYLAKNRNLTEDYALLRRWIDTVLQTETPAMETLRSKALEWGEESNRLYGSRSEGLFNLRHDYVGLGWIKRQLQRAQTAAEESVKRELLEMVVDYEGKEAGAIYDDLGTGTHAPNVVAGYPYDHGQPYVGTMLSESNRPSQRSMHFTQDEEEGVTLHYRGLRPNTAYKLRLTLVRPVFQERYRDRMKQKRQSVYANDELLASLVMLPEFESDFFTYEIPARLVKNGELTIRLRKDPSVLSGDRVETEQWRNTGGWGTLLSEAWLIPQPASSGR